MPNSSLSNKSKARPGPKPGDKDQLVDSSAKLALGAKLLVRALSSYASPQESIIRSSIPQRHDFKEAYSSMLEAIPVNNRKVVLRQLKADLALAETELNLPPARQSVKDRTRKVSTADFMAGLERQEQEQREDDLASGKLIPGSELRARLKVSPQALSAALKAKRMFVMQGPSGEYAYPAFFADTAYDRPVLEKVCKALGDLPGSSKWDFFMAPRISLGGKNPLGALAKGQVEAVMAAAHAFADE